EAAHADLAAVTLLLEPCDDGGAVGEERGVDTSTGGAAVDADRRREGRAAVGGLGGPNRRPGAGAGGPRDDRAIALGRHGRAVRRAGGQTPSIGVHASWSLPAAVSLAHHRGVAAVVGVAVAVSDDGAGSGRRAGGLAAVADTRVEDRLRAEPLPVPL